MDFTIIETTDISALEEYTGAQVGIIRPVPIAELKRFSWNEIRQFMHKYGIYCFPTTELIEHLAIIIKDKNSIEIGCGLGIIGRALGIPITDNKMQEWPGVKKYYIQTRQPIIQYPDDVEELDAMAAGRKYRPDIVIGSYITHLWRPGMENGNQWGVDTIKLINNVTEYYMIGNLEMHTKEDPAMKFLDGYEQHDFIVTRGGPQHSALFRWRKPHFKKHIFK